MSFQIQLGFAFDIINKNRKKMSERPRRNISSEGANLYQWIVLAISKIIIELLFNTVDQSSYKSQAQFDIIRTPIKVQLKPRTPPKNQNPYIYKPKSYSTKRNQGNDQSILQSSLGLPTKKVKRETHGKNDGKKTSKLNITKILQNTLAQHTEYFLDGFFDQKQQRNFSIKFPINQDSTYVRNKNPMLKNQIDIVSNANRKLPVVIHDALLHANTSQKFEFIEYFQQNIPNPYKVNRRDYYLATIPFQKDYKSGYAPIELQMQNNDPAQDQVYNGGSKSHFIRKKQSTLSLPRSCGVSYVKPSQSVQGYPYQPLQPLIFQCSSAFIATQEQTEPYSEMINNFIKTSFSCTLPYIKCQENQMRRLLLGQKIGQVGWVKGIENLWPSFADGCFFLVLIGLQNPTSEDEVWDSFSTAVFKIGMLIKKSTSGRKAFFKSIGMQANDYQISKDELKQKEASLEENKLDVKNQESSRSGEEPKKQLNQYSRAIYEQLKDCRAANTLSIRLETYVEECQWKNLDKKNRAMMYYMTIALKQSLQKRSLKVITRRMSIAKMQNRQIGLQEILNNLRKSKQTGNSPHTMEQENQMIAIKPTFAITHENLCNLFMCKLTVQNQYCSKIFKNTSTLTVDQIVKKNNNSKGQNNWEKGLKLPLYYISTRDSFAFDLIEQITQYNMNGRNFKKIKYYFDPDNLPTNYNNEYRSRFPQFDVGITCYHGLFTDEQLKDFENNTFKTEQNAFKSKFLQMTVQPSIATGKIKRTKFFFGYRYVWTRCQLAEPGSYIGAGVRKDVTNPPRWTNNIVKAFEQNGICDKDFINSIAINVYHDGKQGLAQHFDDAVRFKQPIFTLRLFSDARLSFGSQFYGFCNGAFIIPLPRGCICVMQENSYAANGVKHCVRPCDMTGKSAAVILRQMHHQVVNEAAKFDQMIEFPNWLATLSSKEDSVPYAQQKRRQSQYILQQGKNKKIK